MWKNYEKHGLFVLATSIRCIFFGYQPFVFRGGLPVRKDPRMCWNNICQFDILNVDLQDLEAHFLGSSWFTSILPGIGRAWQGMAGHGRATPILILVNHQLLQRAQVL